MRLPGSSANVVAPVSSAQTVQFDAPAPCCGINTRWRAVASGSLDHNGVRVEYLIETTCACPSVEEAKEIA